MVILPVEGCKAALEGSPSQNHSESCRKRILEAIGGKHAPEVDAQQRRYDIFIDKAATTDDSDDIRQEKKRARFEDADIQAAATFPGTSPAPVTTQTRRESGFLRTMAEPILTKHSWRLPNGRRASARDFEAVQQKSFKFC